MQRIHGMRSLLLFLIAASGLHAGTVADLISAVRAAHNRPDDEVATMVRQTPLTERLDDAVIEQLHGEGAGAKTVEALEWVREETRDLPKPQNPASGGAPAPAELQRMIAEARVVALQYSAALPNFLCTETIRRYQLPKGKPWKLRDTLTIDVAYSDKGERYKPLTIDGKPTKKSMKALGGFISHGEFGSFLKFVYHPESAAEFRWERWGSLRGRRVAVLSYHIKRENSKYMVGAEQSFFRHSQIITGAAGLVYIDPETRRTIRFSASDDGLPLGWPIRQTGAVSDYDYAEVGGQKFLLPRRIDQHVLFREERIRNITEFGNYRKFSSDTTVTFEKQ